MRWGAFQGRGEMEELRCSRFKRRSNFSYFHKLC